MQKTNHIALLVDRSSSMAGITPETIRQINTQIELINRRSKEEGQKTHFSLYTFSDVADRPLLFDVPLDLVTINPLTSKAYTVQGMTALFDCVGTAIYDLSQFHRDVRMSDDHSFLIITITDGQENNSRAYGAPKASQMMQEKVKSDMWSFVFLVPKGGKTTLVNQFGVAEGNVQEWDTNAGVRGVQDYAPIMSQGLNNYFTARSTGLRSVKSFFTTDLSKVKSGDISKLQDVTHGFDKRTVEKEIDIKTFCTYKFGEYLIGNAFYELTKTEKVQAHKKIAIEDRISGRIYGDDAVVRGMLGLPTNAEVKVTPGNHANYRIYIQSTSVNRKLVRGTSVLYHKGSAVGVGR